MAKWLEVADIVRRWIKDPNDPDHVPPGEMLPPYAVLQVKLNAGREAVHRGITQLRREGLVFPRQGIGTIVRELAPSSTSCAPGRVAQTWDQQNPGGVDKLIHAETATADAEIAKRLEIEPGARVVYRLRHHLLGQGVAQVFHQWIPGDIADAVKAATGWDLSDINSPQPAGLPTIFDAIAAAGYPIKETTEKRTARTVHTDEVEILGVPEDAAVLITDRVTPSTNGGRKVDTIIVVSAADRCHGTYTVALNFPGPQGQ